MSKGDQLKWQSARFAFERHRDRDTDTPIGYSLQLFSLPLSTQVCCAKQKRLENRKNVEGGLAQVVERSIRIREAPRSRHGYSNWLFFTIIFIATFNASLLCQTEKVGEQKKCRRVISSSGRALDSHSRGTVIDTRILQLVFLYNYFRCQLQHKFFVPNRKGWRIEQICKGDQLKWQSARFAFDRHRDGDPDTPISFSLQLFSLPIPTQVFCAKQKSLENRNHIYRGICSSGRALDSHSRGTAIETPILQLVILYNYFHCQFQRKFVVPNRKRLKNGNNIQRGISSSGRALDSHSIGNGIETRILQLVILYNYFHCQFQRKFVVPNRKVWRKETKYKRDQLKQQSARFAFESHRDRYPDTPIG